MEVSKNGRPNYTIQNIKKIKNTGKNKISINWRRRFSTTKKIVESPILEFEELTKEGRKFAKEKGMKNKDVTKLIQKINRDNES